METVITAPSTPEAAQWDGYGTALKPAWEPIILAMRPLDSTFADNALRWGCGGLNIDGCRISAEAIVYKNGCGGGKNQVNRMMGGNVANDADFRLQPWANTEGRWPANLLLDEESAELLDEASGLLTSGNNPAKRSSDKHQTVYAGWKGAQCLVHRKTDSGYASRFFYIAKADSAERSAGLRDRNQHPTVKPIDLAAYLAKLILPPKRDTPRRIITPFCGSGSEIIGALRAGWEEAVGIEQDAKWCDVARERIVGDAPLFTRELQP